MYWSRLIVVLCVWIFMGACCYLQAFSCCGEQASCCGGFSCCGAQSLHVQLSVAVAHGLWSAQALVVVACDFVNPRHVGSSQTRGRTHVPCIGRRILNHWTTREVPACMFKDTFSTKLFLGASLTIFLILFA